MPRFSHSVDLLSPHAFEFSEIPTVSRRVAGWPGRSRRQAARGLLCDLLQPRGPVDHHGHRRSGGLFVLRRNEKTAILADVELALAGWEAGGGKESPWHAEL